MVWSAYSEFKKSSQIQDLANYYRVYSKVCPLMADFSQPMGDKRQKPVLDCKEQMFQLMKQRLEELKN